MVTIPSPCTGICAIDAATKQCTGCHRTLDEIARWGTGTDADRRAILAAVAKRKSSPGRGGGSAQR